MGSAGHTGRSRRSLGAGARSRGRRGARCSSPAFRATRRRWRCGDRAASFSLRRFLHARPDRAGCPGEGRAARSIDGFARHLSVSCDAAVFAARPAREEKSCMWPKSTRAPRSSSIAGRCLSVSARSSDCRAALTCAMAIPSIFTRWPPTIPASRSSFRTSAQDFFARHCSSPTLRRTSTSTRRAPTGGWRTIQGLTLPGVFMQALEVAGPERVLFGTDSSFFPRGWNRAVFDAQVSALDAAGVAEGDRHRIFTANFDRLFPA